MSEKKDAYYFSHDANARNDFKILRLRRTLGLEGYGIYFCLVEMLREQKDFTLLLESVPDFAYALNTSEEKVKAVILNFQLFEIEENRFFSVRLIKSMNAYKSLTQKRIEAGRKGGKASVQAKVKQRSSKGQARLNDCSSIKGKEIKGKEINKTNKKKQFIPPTLSEVKDYVRDNNFSVNPDTFYKFFTEGNWIDSKGNKVQSWKQKLITWNSNGNTGKPKKADGKFTGIKEKNWYEGVNDDGTF
ncbi:MAG: DUF4373 domain-containing protein [Maribacter sp.]|nr:DUF4373 domain-containing protein [Maribacter sp.]